MEIDKNKRYEIIVFPNQDEGLKAQRIMVSRGIDFKHISTLAVVVPEPERQTICRTLVDEGASYNKNASTLTYAKERRLINLYNIKVTIAKADDIIDAWVVLDEVKKLINDTYSRKDSIRPSYEEKIKVTALQIYGWLPKTNCKTCGEATCLAFAVKLLMCEQKLKNYKPLFTDAKFVENKNIMQEMMEALGIV